jgi:hypothetical protein
LWTTICSISGSSSSPAYCQPICLSRLCLLKVHMEISSWPLPHSVVCTPPSLPCVLFSSLFIIEVFFFWGVGGKSVQGPMLVYPRDSCGNTICCLFAYLLICISQAGLELASGSMGALLFSQCSVVWRSFIQAGDSGCWSFASFCGFFSAKCGSSISARFLIYGVHTVSFLPLVAILDPR